MKKTRQAALAAHEKWYLTNKPCKHGHISKQSTLDGSCHECRLIKQREKRKMIKAILNDD